MCLLDPLYHPLLEDDGETIKTCDYGAMMDLSQLIINVYLIVKEALDDERNKEIINEWNISRMNKIIEENEKDNKDNDILVNDKVNIDDISLNFKDNINELLNDETIFDINDSKYVKKNQLKKTS